MAKSLFFSLVHLTSLIFFPWFALYMREKKKFMKIVFFFFVFVQKKYQTNRAHLRQDIAIKRVGRTRTYIPSEKTQKENSKCANKSFFRLSARLSTHTCTDHEIGRVKFWINTRTQIQNVYENVNDIKIGFLLKLPAR